MPAEKGAYATLEPAFASLWTGPRLQFCYLSLKIDFKPGSEGTGLSSQHSRDRGK